MDDSSSEIPSGMQTNISQWSEVSWPATLTTTPEKHFYNEKHYAFERKTLP